ncbi:MAG: TetR/AcrR family transcriptional regulator [Hyphomicrobium sp.]
MRDLVQGLRQISKVSPPMSESRDRLVAAATDLFLGGSFHNVGIAEICEAAKINKGTFYHFFPSKIDLLLEVIDGYVTGIAARYDAIADGDDTPSRKLRSVFMVPQTQNESWKAVHGVASGCFLGNIILELAATEPLVRDKAKWAIDRWSAALQPIVAEFLKAEKIQNLDAPAAADVIIGVVQGAHVLAKVKNDPSVFATYASLSAEMLRAAGNPK